MDRTDSSRLRKHLMSEPSSTHSERPGETDIASDATHAYSSEDPDHPLEHLIDRHFGPGATRCTVVVCGCDSIDVASGIGIYEIEKLSSCLLHALESIGPNHDILSLPGHAAISFQSDI